MLNVNLRKIFIVQVFVLGIACPLSSQILAQGTLQCGVPRDGSLHTAEYHYWTFPGETGEKISLSLITTYDSSIRFQCGGSFFGHAELFKPSDSKVPFVENIGSLVDIDIPENGTYTLRIHDSDLSVGCAGYGNYRVCLERLWPVDKRCDAVALCGERIDRNMTTSEQDLYRFAGKAGDVYKLTLITTYDSSIRFQCGGSFSVLGFLHGPDFLAGPILSSINGDYDITLPVDGIYTLRVMDSDLIVGCAGYGSYFLSFYRSNPTPACDCNGNGIGDDLDLAQGTSRDDNGDNLPDECKEVASVWIVDQGGGLGSLMVNNFIPIRGGELALRYDGAIATLASENDILPGKDLPGGAIVTKDLTPATNSCATDPEVNQGFTLGWINSQDQNVLTPPGTWELFKLRFTMPRGTCTKLKFSPNCLGEPGFLIRNVLTNQAGSSMSIAAFDGMVCRPEGDFRRGDANGDGRFDISDPISILTCKFLSVGCTSCTDASDTDDSGAIDPTDAILLLTWRFLSGPGPKAPFPACGQDPTDADEYTECKYTACQ